MTYLDSGYNQYFQRNILGEASLDQDLTPFDRDISSEGFSGDRVVGGQMKSANGNVIINLDEGYISISSGGVERLRLGIFAEGDGTGLRVKDTSGKTLVKISEAGNFLQGASENLIFNFDEENIIVKDNGLPRVLIGKQVGGF